MRFIIISAVVFLTLAISINAQSNKQVTIKGTVHDKQNGAPLENVNVFLSSTTIGTTTDKYGQYCISNVPFGAYGIVFSMIGYRSGIRKFHSYYPDTLTFDIFLEQKPITLNEVNITGKAPKDWNDNFEKFKLYFLGESDNSRKTKILNPVVLYFKNDSSANTFKAYSDSTLRIENKALGYMVYITLDSLVKFESGETYMVFRPLFKELEPSGKSERLKWEENRQQAYLDSPRHFLYAMVHKELDKDYYTMHGNGGAIFPDELSITCNDDSTIYELRFEGTMLVKRDWGKPCTLNFFRPTTSIDKYGNLLSIFMDVLIGGEWSNQRISDLLPLNYIYDVKD